MLTIVKRMLQGIMMMLIMGLLFFMSIYLISFFLGPPEVAPEKNTIIFDASAQKALELKGAENRSWVSLEQISPFVKDAIVATEDQQFYEHDGFDLKGILRATWHNIKSSALKEGASTITQQYARNLFLTHEKTWSRKIKEAFYTIRLEMYYSKDEILEGYLNMIYFGHGAYGIEAASQFYFGKNAIDLSLAEAAMLAAIPKGPTYYSPFNDLMNAKNRQQLILENLKSAGKITAAAYEAALQEPLSFQQESPSSLSSGDYFFDAVIKEAQQLLQVNRQAIHSGGYEIHTTYDQDLQAMLEASIKEQMTSNSELQVAALTMQPDSGAIVSMVGGEDYDQSPFNRAISAQRMSGSTFKPFLYYAALESNYTATTTLMSQPTTFQLGNGETYQPQNFNGYYAEQPITLAEALAVSDNIYAVKTNLFLGPERLKKTAQRFGIKSDLPAVPSLALGTASVSLHEMVTAYGMLANNGREITGHTITKIIDRHGQLIYEREVTPHKRLFEHTYTFLLTHLLMGMFDVDLAGYTTVTGASIAEQLTRPYAGKSGTTPFDSWMIGYSPSLVTGIWTGYDDHREMEIATEKAYAKNIWAQFMEQAHINKPLEEFSIPEGVIGLPIDPETGLISTPYCPNNRMMYFIKGTEPLSYCTVHFSPDDREYYLQGEEKITKRGFFRRLFDLFTEFHNTILGPLLTI